MNDYLQNIHYNLSDLDDLITYIKGFQSFLKGEEPEHDCDLRRFAILLDRYKREVDGLLKRIIKGEIKI